MKRLLMQGKEYQRTEHECPECGGTMYRGGYERVCGNCYCIIDSEKTVKRPEPWQDFWSEREYYSGFHGPDRVKMVGGFAAAYQD